MSFKRNSAETTVMPSPCFDNRSEEFQSNLSKAADLVEKISTIGGLSVCDRQYHLRTYRNCFVASQLVDWFIEAGLAEDRKSGVKLGQILVDTDYIHHVVDEHNFEDGYLFFRFRKDEPPGVSLQGPSVVCIKGQQGGLVSQLMVKKLLGWSTYTFAISPVDKMLYQFRTEHDSSPLYIYPLELATIQPYPPSGIKQLMTYTSKDRKKTIQLAMTDENKHFLWLKAFSELGAEVLPLPEEIDSIISSATSICKFEARDIDGFMQSLSKYRGHVTLIVNVASQ